MKSVLISIKPKWCELIASGKKTVEVRKTKPKLETPFKVYIYCTKGEEVYLPRDIFGDEALNGKVIGEFVCDRIYEIYQCHSGWVAEKACISRDKFFDYLGIPRGTHMGYHKKAYSWNISDLVIYDKPRELSEFYAEGDCDCMNCKKCAWFDRGNGYNVESDCNLAYKGVELHKSLKPIIRPPQSWCYVESEGEG